jgi:hypothetical protein
MLPPFFSFTHFIFHLELSLLMFQVYMLLMRTFWGGTISTFSVSEILNGDWCSGQAFDCS